MMLKWIFVANLGGGKMVFPQFSSETEVKYTRFQGRIITTSSDGGFWFAFFPETTAALGTI